MAETTGEGAISKTEQWRERIAEQERRGISVRQFCKEQGLAEHCFYGWRKRLRERHQPMRFALVQTARVRPEPVNETNLELVLTSGERLCIGTGVDVATLRAVLDVLRA